MRRRLLPPVAALLAAAGPTTAQRNDWMPDPGSTPVPVAPPSVIGPGTFGAADERDVLGRIRDARDAGLITRSEARAYRREARADAALVERLGRDGLSDDERRELEGRALALRERVGAPR